MFMSQSWAFVEGKKEINKLNSCNNRGHAPPPIAKEATTKLVNLEMTNELKVKSSTCKIRGLKAIIYKDH